MKKALKRILTFALVLCLTVIGVVTVPMVSANAEEQTATLSFANKAQRTSFSTTQQVWTQNGVTFTNDKASSSNAVADYAAPVRLYASSKVTVEHESNQITQILFDCNSDSYATALKNSIGTVAGATTTVSSDKVTIAFSEAKDSFAIAKLTAQVRLDSLTVTYTEAAEGETPAPILKLTGNDYVQIGDDLTLTATAENFGEGLEVVWESDNEEVALVDEDGIVTGVSMGTANVTVTATDNDGNEESKTLAVKVYPANSNPITIAEAIEICKLAGNTNTPYPYTATGTIKGEVDYNDTYSNYTVIITDGTDEIKVYGVKEESNKELLTGMSITVTGSLINYKDTTPEFNSGSTCVINKTDAQEATQEALNAVNAYMSLSYKYTQTTEMQEVASETEVLFNLGNDGSAGTETTAAKTTYSETVGNYTLSLTNAAKMYTACTDTTGKGCIKLGTSSAVGGFSFTVPAEVTSVVIAVAQYKANATKISVNDTSYTITTSSNNGAYTDITVDTTANKTVSFTTVSGGVRAMVNSITYVIATAGEGMEEVTVMKDSDFRIRCGVDASLLEIAGEYNFGIQVSANGKTVEYTTTATSWTEEDGMVYVVISLGDIINDLTKLNTKFTVSAFVEVDGVILTSTASKSMSVVDMVANYVDVQGIEEVTPLYDYLANAGLI